MSTSIRIEIIDTVSPDLVHRFRNLGEDIYRGLHESCTVSLKEIDAATTSFVVREIRRRNLGNVRRFIERELRNHHFDDSARMVQFERRTSTAEQGHAGDARNARA